MPGLHENAFGAGLGQRRRGAGGTVARLGERRPVGYFRVRSLAEGGCVAWMLRLVRRWCTRWMEGEMTPAPVRYATTRWQRTDFGRPVSSIRFRTVTPMAASACWAAKPRARSQGPISAL